MRVSFILYYGIKTETGKKIQKSTWNKFSEVFIQIPGTYKKTLR